MPAATFDGRSFMLDGRRIWLVSGSIHYARVPHEQWGEAVHAEVMPKADAVVTEAELIAHCRTLIAGYKLPRSVHIRSGALPKSGAGKILKKDLRAPFWEGHERGVN